MLRGIPNFAVTEAFAMMFGRRQLELLGLGDAAGKDPLQDLQSFWFTYETSGVALAELKIWQWMYAHPDALVSQFREAVIDMAKDIWNRYYAPVFNVTDVPILVIYSHLIGGYLDFPLRTGYLFPG